MRAAVLSRRPERPRLRTSKACERRASPWIAPPDAGSTGREPNGSCCVYRPGATGDLAQMADLVIRSRSTHDLHLVRSPVQILAAGDAHLVADRPQRPAAGAPAVRLVVLPAVEDGGDQADHGQA